MALDMPPAQLDCAPHLIVDEDDEIDFTAVMAPAVEGLVRPVAMKVRAQVAKPVPMKVARPIPQRATEQFYDEAYRQGIPAYAVNAAIMESHDWHRKWTQQDEEGHTMPHDNQSSLPMGTLPQQYAYQSHEVPDMVLDRLAGARNPSPEWGGESNSPQHAERKRGRFDDGEYAQEAPVHDAPTGMPPMIQILWENQRSAESTPSELRDSQDGHGEDDGEDGHMLAPAAKRPVPVRPAAPTLEEDDDDDVYGVDGPQQPPANMVVRPVALRVPRPIIAKMPSSSSMCVPKFVSADEESCSKISVITQSTGLSGYDNMQTEGPRATLVEDEEGECCNLSMEESLVVRRDALLQALAISGGDAQAEAFTATIEPLQAVFDDENVDTREVEGGGDKSVQGTWLTLTKPTFFGNLGENDAGDPMYTLGRMTFDMFSPTNLVCSLQGNFNSIEIVGDEERGSMLEAGLVPKGLREEVENRSVVLRTYK